MNLFNWRKSAKGQRNEDMPVNHDGYPDSSKPYGLCPRCSKQSSFDLIGTVPATFAPGMVMSPMMSHGTRPISDQIVSLQCRNCQQPIIVLEEEHIGGKPSREGISRGEVTWKGFFWWPFSSPALSPDVPAPVQKVMQEAKVCYFTECYRASAAMSRRALEAVTVDKGENTGVLAKRIAKLVTDGILDKNLGDWATEVRLLGNMGAHFDPIEDVSKDDANQIMLFIEELIKYVYIMPAEVARRRGQRS